MYVSIICFHKGEGVSSSSVRICMNSCGRRLKRLTQIILMGTGAWCGLTSSALAEDYFLRLEPISGLYDIKYPSGDAACIGVQNHWPGLVAKFVPDYFGAEDFRAGKFAGGRCYMFDQLTGRPLGPFGVTLVGDSCPIGATFNNLVGTCELSGAEIKRKSLGLPEDKLSCNAPVLFQGNPINVAIGNKFQAEVDYTLERARVGPPSLRFVRYYNSLNGLWVHSYSAYLTLTADSIVLVGMDGRQSLFARSGNAATPEPTEMGSLTQSGTNWIYRSPSNEVETFNASGQLVGWEALGDDRQTLTYDDSSVTVSDSEGHTLTFTQDTNHQPLSLQAGELSVTYGYNAFGHLNRVVRTRTGVTEIRQYHYEVSTTPTLLTGLTDERGVRFATWSYDTQGRAISSEHAHGTEKVTLSYNDDGSTTVTNEFGQQTIYRYQIIQGVKRIVAIEGEPSPNCSASNSSYTYNDRGQVLTKTDALGLLTTYTYNDRGLEISRTEANGTPLARTTTTEWDPVRFLRTQVVEPTRTTLYSYDGQGRALSQQVISH